MCTEPSRLLTTFSPIRASTVGSCASAGRYSLRTIDGGTFQVGLTVMNFIVSVSIGVAVVGLPTTTRVCQISLAVLHHPQRVVRDVQHDVGIAEIARQPAPALHIGDDGVDHIGAARRRRHAIEAAQRAPGRSGRPGLIRSRLLVVLDRGGERIVVAQVGLVALATLSRWRSSGTRASSAPGRSDPAIRNAHDLAVLRAQSTPRNSASLALSAR